jgi:hypothetical protein
MFSTPVLLVIFKRPRTIEKVMEVIRQLKPLHLFIAADGPRTDKPGEAAVCDQTREIALQGIDWPCELKTLFQTYNLGCGVGVATAISWFFEQVDEGISRKMIAFQIKVFLSFVECCWIAT